MPKNDALRGEVWLIDFGLAAKVRPALVISKPCRDEDRALIAVIPHTTKLRGSSLEVVVSAPFLKKGAFMLQGFATVPPPCFIRKLGTLSTTELAIIEGALREWLAM